MFVGNWNLRVNMPRRHLKRSLPNTPRFPFFKERCCLWPRTQRCRAWETGSFSSGVGLLCLPQVTPTPTIPACRTGHGFIYFSLAQFGSTGFLSCSEQPHSCVKEDKPGPWTAVINPCLRTQWGFSAGDGLTAPGLPWRTVVSHGPNGFFSVGS